MTQNKKAYILSISIIGVLFFIFGFVTWLNGPLIPFFKTTCELTEFQSYLVTFSFYIAYFVMAIPSSWVLQKTGYKNGMALGLLIIAIGAFLFYPAASVRTFGFFLTALFVMGTGLALLQTASNPYIVVIGPRESAAARISILGICNKAAGFLAPLVLIALVLQGMNSKKDAVYTQWINMEESAMLNLGEMQNEHNQTTLVLKKELMSMTSDEALKKAKRELSFDAIITNIPVEQKNDVLNSLSKGLQIPYLWMGVILVILAFLTRISPLPEISLEDEKEKLTIGQQLKGVVKYPQLILGVITIFVYLLCEVLAGDSIGSFGKRMGVFGDSGSFYLTLTSFTMTAMVIGYILGILLIPKYLKQETALKSSAILGAILVSLIVLLPQDSFGIYNTLFSWTSIPPINNPIFMVALLGLANALMWPAIWPMAIDGIGKYTKIGAALLIMGILGGAVLPLLYGAWADWINASLEANNAQGKSGNQIAYLILIPAYLWILFYAFKGHKYRSWSRK